jgi:uncharacterized protein (DUF433 family)
MMNNQDGLDHKDIDDLIARLSLRKQEAPSTQIPFQYVKDILQQEGLLESLLKEHKDHNFVGQGIEKETGVCGGSACIAGTRITVWGLVESRQIGYSEADILTSYLTISATDLVNAWAYAAAFPDEIAAEIKENNDVMREGQ